MNRTRPLTGSLLALMLAGSTLLLSQPAAAGDAGLLRVHGGSDHGASARIGYFLPHLYFDLNWPLHHRHWNRDHRRDRHDRYERRDRYDRYESRHRDRKHEHGLWSPPRDYSRGGYRPRPSYREHY